jgi:hypothetical protein
LISSKKEFPGKTNFHENIILCVIAWQGISAIISVITWGHRPATAALFPGIRNLLTEEL